VQLGEDSKKKVKNLGLTDHHALGTEFKYLLPEREKKI
jgi:hypothetical protein